MGLSRYRLTVCFVIAWIAGLAVMAGIQMVTDPSWGWFGVLMAMGALMSAVPAAIALAILLILARPVGENPLIFAVLGPPLVIAGSELLDFDVAFVAAQVSVIASIAFYALAKLWGPKPEPDPY